MFETIHNSEILPGSTQISLGSQRFGSTDVMRDYRVKDLGQVTDPTTGITGKNGAVALAKAKAQGLSGSALDSFIDRIGGKRG